MVCEVFIDGVRGVPQSYSIVNDAQIAALTNRGVIFSEDASVNYRIRMPFDFTGDSRTFVFATAETHWLPKHRISRGRIGDIKIVTPSEFSRRGLIRTGAKPENVSVIPHGVDVVFRPYYKPRSHVYQFLNVSSLRAVEKGIDLLLSAFAVVAQRHNNARLVLKGCDQVYPSRRWFMDACRDLKQEERRSLEGKVRYIGETMHTRTLADLYRSSDCYVSPYRAEAFNLPVLEALACGLPVICTQGGPTDDLAGYGPINFVTSKVITRGVEPEEMILEPDLDDLAAQMLAMIQGTPHRQVPQLANGKLIQDDFSWDRAAGQLIDLFTRSAG